MKKIPLSIVTLYQDLLDKKMDQELFLANLKGESSDGTFVSKTVKGNLYWYFQTYENGVKKQRYVGPDNEDTKEMIDRLKSYREAVKNSSSEELVSALKNTPGVPRVYPDEGKIILSLEKSGVFRNGGILVGTQAFRCYPLIIGSSLSETAARTGDIDVAYDRGIQIFVPESTDTIVSRIRSEISLLPIPTLDPKGRSYSFKIGGSDLKLEVLTTIKEEPDPERLKSIKDIGFYAQPLEYMDYLIKNPVKAVLLYEKGVLVNIPSPERFAIHKVLLSQIRDESSKVKSMKDIVQAGLLIDALSSQYPTDLMNAIHDLSAMLGKNESPRHKFLSGLSSLKGKVPSDVLTKLIDEFERESSHGRGEGVSINEYGHESTKSEIKNPGDNTEMDMGVPSNEEEEEILGPS